ncbi:complement factor H-like [Leuresthes tenuis]|uniref:complement factor H-like n=1 Tax=Leuresthes tenuis TaxID=355514 RepID=UPI003B50C442
MHLIFKSCVLFLWMQTLTFVRARDCTREEFLKSQHYDLNFDTTGLDDTYPPGAQVRVPCNVGHGGFFKMTCSENGWLPTQSSSKCTPKSCGHPGDAQFADFRLEGGEDFVFGSHVVYTCRDGYEMVSRTNHRYCTANGWDGVVPVCEIRKCPVLRVGNNVNVIGDPDDATYGNILRFDCTFNDQILSGPSQIYCDETGKWSDEVPTCKEISCDRPVIEHGRVLDGTPKYKEHQVLNFVCDSEYKPADERNSQCSKIGSRAVWSPTPTCKPINCQVSLSLPGTTFNPPNRNIFAPKDKLRVTCGEKYWILNTQTTTAEVTCKDDGEWTSEPKCKEVICNDPINQHVRGWYANWQQKKFDGIVDYSCRSGYEKPIGTTWAKCTRKGWTPKPLCEGTRCNRPNIENAEIVSREKEHYVNGETVTFSCSYGSRERIDLQCLRGQWTGVRSCPGKACLALQIENGFAVGPIANTIYYSCNETYKLYTNGWWDEATCNNAKWSKLPRCIEQNKCGEPPVFPNGIASPGLDSASPQSLAIVCDEGYQPATGPITCVDGNWDLHHVSLETICSPTEGHCGKPPKVENSVIKMSYRKVFLSGTTITYECRNKYKMKGESTVTCQAGIWEKKTMKCVSYCDELKDNTLIVVPASAKEEYFHDDVIQYHCIKTCEALGGNARCVMGEWMKSVYCPAKCEEREDDKVPTGTAGCSDPPPLDYGDIKESLKPQYEHNERVEYKCMRLHKMEGGPYRICVDGQWIGEIKCLQPCTVNSGDMTANNIKMLHGYSKLYSEHGDYITFECIRGTHHVGSESLRPRCENGVMTLPKCQNCCICVCVCVFTLHVSHEFLNWAQMRLFFSEHIQDSMKLWLILLFLQLWENLEVSSQNACSKAPDVPHTHVSEDTKKAEYQEWNVINFECYSGYTSDQSSKFVCTSRGWHVVRQGTCFFLILMSFISKHMMRIFFHVKMLPSETFCLHDPNNHPPAVDRLIIHGFPDNNSTIPPNHILIFSCDDPGKHLDGSSVVICGKDGQWSNPVPSCRENTCEIGVIHPHLFVAGLPPTSQSIAAGHKLRFQCSGDFQLKGSEEIQCLQSGQWNSPFPTCAENTCEIGVIHPHLFVAGLPPTSQSIAAGHKLRFQCSGDFQLKGSEEIQCLQSGQWNSPFPTCAGTAGCSDPPPLDYGDIKESLKPQYEHNERVEYKCMRLHKMEGGPYRTCVDGQWIGEIKCLQPCTVNSGDMTANNIKMLHGYSKLFAEHGDYITFECIRGTHHVGSESLRPRCENGVMTLPKCQN